MSEDVLDFDVLVLSEGEALEPPSPERLEEVRRWFETRDARCEPTTFGLACRAPISKLTEIVGGPPEAGVELPIPDELAGLVTQISIPKRPTFFSP